MSPTPEILHHVFGEKDDEFFGRIDRLGGWPVAAKWVVLRHETARTCWFSKEWVGTGWNTAIRSADDYYRWKLSPEAISKIKDEERRRIAHALL